MVSLDIISTLIKELQEDKREINDEINKVKSEIERYKLKLYNLERNYDMHARILSDLQTLRDRTCSAKGD